MQIFITKVVPVVKNTCQSSTCLHVISLSGAPGELPGEGIFAPVIETKLPIYKQQALGSS